MLITVHKNISITVYFPSMLLHSRSVGGGSQPPIKRGEEEEERVTSSLQHGGRGCGRLHRTEPAVVGLHRDVSRRLRERQALEVQEGVFIQKHLKLRGGASRGPPARAVHGVGQPRVPGLQVRGQAARVTCFRTGIILCFR